MAHEWLERDDLSVFVIGGVPRGFGQRLTEMLAEQGEDATSLRLGEELSDWVLARVRGQYRDPRSRGAAAEALWRAFSALAAARYHLGDDPDLAGEVKRLRGEVERLWSEARPVRGEAAD